MNRRELRALQADSEIETSTRRGRTRSSGRSNITDSEQITELEAALVEARRKIDEQKVELDDAERRSTELEIRINDTEAELENVKLRAEVEMLCAVEKVREEERCQSQRWSDDLRDRFQVEKRILEEKVARLEAASTSRATSDTDEGSSDTPAGGHGSTPVSISPSTHLPLRLRVPCHRVLVLLSLWAQV